MPTLNVKRGQQPEVPAIDTKGVFTLDEFNFPHAVMIHEAALKPETLLSQYRKLFTFL